MAELRLVLAHDPRRLLEHAADGFLAPPRATSDHPFPSPGYLLALRQGGLRDDLVTLAAERGVRGWFDPPLGVFHELPKWLGTTARVPCGDVERRVLLAAAVRRAAGTVLGRLRNPEAYLDAVDRLFGELAAEGVDAARLDAAFAGCADRDDFQLRRDAELAAAYRAYLEELQRLGRRDGRDTYLDCAAAVAADPDALARRLGGRRELRLVGLQDLRGGWRPLLRALAASPALDAVVIYTSLELDLADVAPTSVQRLDETSSAPALAARLFAEPVRGTERVALIAAPDVEREMEEVARRVRAAVDAGTPPHRIAVVSRQARPYMELAVAALERAGVPATARRRTALTEVPALRALLSVLAAAAQGWTRHGMVEVAEQPYLETGLDPAILNVIGYRRRVMGLGRWGDAIDELLREAEARDERAAARAESDDDRRTPLPDTGRIRETRVAFTAFARRMVTLERRRTLPEWLAWLADLLDQDAWRIVPRIHDAPGGRVALARLDLAGWEALRRVVKEWRAALERSADAGDVLDVAAFEQRLRGMLGGEVALWTPVHRGVQVVEGLAAAYRSFDELFIVGLEAGRFPVRAPRSPLLDEAEREALAAAGLPLEPRAVWDALERNLFRALVAATRRLTLSFARLDASGREVIPSAFIEAVREVAEVPEPRDAAISASRVVTPGISLCRSAAVAAHAARVARIERSRATGEPSRHNGVVEDPALRAWLADEFGENRVWSPTQLEAYAKCPWSYLATRLLGLERPTDPDEEMEPAVRGVILHDALARFFRQAARQVDGRPVFLRAVDRAWARRVAARELDAALAEADAAQQWLGHPSLREAKRSELHRLLLGYVDAEIDLNEKTFNIRTKAASMLRTGVVEHELHFEDAVLEVEGVRIRYRGSVDRVEREVDERLRPDDGEFLAAVDYKTTRGAVPGGGDKAAWDDDVVLQVPLYAHALAQRHRGARVARVEYRALQQREAVHVLELWQVDKRTGKLTPNEEAAEKMARALAAVARHVAAARAGSFPARPAQSCGCPSYCPARDVCRVKGGPQLKGWL